MFAISWRLSGRQSVACKRKKTEVHVLLTIFIQTDRDLYDTRETNASVTQTQKLHTFRPFVSYRVITYGGTCYLLLLSGYESVVTKTNCLMNHTGFHSRSNEKSPFLQWKGEEGRCLPISSGHLTRDIRRRIRPQKKHVMMESLHGWKGECHSFFEWKHLMSCMTSHTFFLVLTCSRHSYWHCECRYQQERNLCIQRAG